MNTLEEFQGAVTEWSRAAWPTVDVETEGLVLAEEVGELCRALAKRSQGIRGTREEWTAELRKELGDVLVVAAVIAECEGWSLMECGADRLRILMARDPNARRLPEGAEG